MHTKTLQRTLFIAAVLVGVSILLYPAVSDWLNARYQSRAVTDYQVSVENSADADLAQITEDARQFNADLFEAHKGKFGPLPQELKERYWTALAPDSAGIIGYLNIPSIGETIPMKCGTSEEVLANSVGHMEGTSLPVGGASTHTAIVGHRGLPSATLFSHLDQVREGDKVYLHVLGEVLAYQVDAIETVLPREVDRLAITPGEDRLTLVTCTPYSINTHRLLVHASRVAYEPEEEESIAAEKPRSAVVDTAFLFLALGLVCAALMVVLIPRYYRVKARRSERTQGPERPTLAVRQSKKPKGGKRLVEEKKRKRRRH